MKKTAFKRASALILCAPMLLPCVTACEKAPLTADGIAQNYLAGIDGVATVTFKAQTITTVVE